MNTNLASFFIIYNLIQQTANVLIILRLSMCQSRILTNPFQRMLSTNLTLHGSNGGYPVFVCLSSLEPDHIS